MDRPSGRRALWVGLALGVILIAAAIRLTGLTHPERMYFDEVYYADDALAVAAQGVEERTPAHPPLGPMLISVGVLVGDGEPWSWRIMPALAGTAMVAFTYLTARRLSLRRPAATAAAALVALDGLAITVSRIAMLDVFLGLFVLIGAWALAGALDHPPDDARWRGWLAGAGLSMGLAASVKWSGVFALAGVGLLATIHLVMWLRETGVTRRRLAVGIGGLSVALALIPAVTYVLSHTSWFLNYEHTAVYEQRCPDGGCETSGTELAAIWWDEQLELIDYHRSLAATHPYRSEPETWPLLIRPVLYYFEECQAGTDPLGCAVPPGERAKILGLGNPALWWATVAVVPAIGWFAIRGRRWAVVVSALIAAQYLPWFLVDKPGYLFYMTPLVPFMALGVAGAATTLGRRTNLALGALVTIAAILALYFAPIWLGFSRPEAVLDARLWLDSWR